MHRHEALTFFTLNKGCAKAPNQTVLITLSQKIVKPNHYVSQTLLPRAKLVY